VAVLAVAAAAVRVHFKALQVEELQTQVAAVVLLAEIAIKELLVVLVVQEDLLFVIHEHR
jgi:hypothetical protein